MPPSGFASILQESTQPKEPVTPQLTITVPKAVVEALLAVGGDFDVLKAHAMSGAVDGVASYYKKLQKASEK